MKQIHFIINPIAGSGEKRLSINILRKFFELEAYNIELKYSSFKGHAIDLTKESINQEADVIVACGGDGTINEVASVLVGTGIPLGILPIGSGNGLASHLKIPKNLVQAIQVLKNNNFKRIDVGCINNRYFFSNVGFGFTAHVIGNYEAEQKRTIVSYTKATLKSFFNSDKRKNTVISVDNISDINNPFLVFISNSNEMGYKMSLTPKASLEDGLLDIIIVPKIGKLKMLFFCVCMLLKRPTLLKEAKCFQTKDILLTLKQGNRFQSQIDGELVKIGQSSISISVKEQALIVLM